MEVADTKNQEPTPTVNNNQSNMKSTTGFSGTFVEGNTNLICEDKTSDQTAAATESILIKPSDPTREPCPIKPKFSRKI